MTMVQLETIANLKVWVNPAYVTLIWAHPVGEECTLVMPDGRMTDVKGTAEQVAARLRDGA